MTRRYDVVVIGAGLAGRMAALAAAEEGVSVLLVSESESTMRSSTGLVDLLGYMDGRTDPIAEPFDSIPELPSSHPLHNRGESAILEAFGLFDEAVGDGYRGGHTDRNGLIPTQLGTPTPTARYPRSFEAGLLSRGEEMLLLGIEGLPGFDGPFAARELASYDPPFDVSGGTIDPFGSTLPEQPRLRLARALDENERWGAGGQPNGAQSAGSRTRARLAAEIERVHDGQNRIGLPAVLGRERTQEIRDDLADAVGVSIFEYPTDPPSLPGIRLADRLDRALRNRGVELRTGMEVSGVSIAESAIEHLQIDGGTRTVRGREFVLATGGLIGGGLVESDGRIVEPLLGLTVSHPERSEWVREDPLARQPFATAGLRIDQSLRPLDSLGNSDGRHRNSNPQFDNLRACGAVLGGYDLAYEHSAGGVAIATGVRAGRLAAQEGST